MEKRTIVAFIFIAVFYLSCQTPSGGSNGSSESNGGSGNSSSSSGILSADAGKALFAKINTLVTINGSATGYTSAGWVQLGGTAVDNLVSNGLQLTFTVNPVTPNFEELSFRLTVSNNTVSESSDITVTAVKYSKVYRLGTFNTSIPAHQTEWKLDWTAGDANGDNAYTPGYWFTFDDSNAASPGPGNSWIIPNPIDSEDKLFSPGFGGKGKCLKMEYKHATNGYTYTFVGFGLKFADNPDPNHKQPFEISSTTGVAFRIKSDSSRSIKVSMVSPKYNSWGTYDAGFVTSEDWEVKEFNWTDFVFPPAGWNPGTKYPITDILKQMAGIQFQTTSQTQSEIGTFYIDDVIIYEL